MSEWLLTFPISYVEYHVSFIKILENLSFKWKSKDLSVSVLNITMDYINVFLLYMSFLMGSKLNNCTFLLFMG